MNQRRIDAGLHVAIAIVFATIAATSSADERIERFDKDPEWDGRNHRSTHHEPRNIRQDFGFSRTGHASGGVGEIGGFITPTAEPAYYARSIPAKTFDDKLSASGLLAVTGRQSHVLIGFFNSKTAKEWRTPNSIALRVSGRGEVFYSWVEYATSRWRAGGDHPTPFPMVTDPETGRGALKGFPLTKPVRWSLTYDPKANMGGGAVTATINDHVAVCHLSEGHKSDGAVFDRFGLLTVMKSADTGGELWLDNVSVNGELDSFDHDPKWTELGNRRTFVTTNIRPRFDFGFSSSQYAGGSRSGELGGLIFRGDCRYPQSLAYYGDRLATLTIEKPLRAGGKVCFSRGVSDSTVLFGFFHSRDSTTVNASQDSGLPRCFLGVAIDGPSREGFYFAPVFRNAGDDRDYAAEGQSPYIYPDGQPHDWSLQYDPVAAGGNGRITVTLDRQAVHLELQSGHKKAGAHFDRFGIVTTWIDGNGQLVYLDDLTYTWKQP